MGAAAAENVAWSYELPPEPVTDIAGLIAFYANRVDSIEETPLTAP